MKDISILIKLKILYLLRNKRIFLGRALLLVLIIAIFNFSLFAEIFVGIAQIILSGGIYKENVFNFITDRYSYIDLVVNDEFIEDKLLVRKYSVKHVTFMYNDKRYKGSLFMEYNDELVNISLRTSIIIPYNDPGSFEGLTKFYNIKFISKCHYDNTTCIAIDKKIYDRIISDKTGPNNEVDLVIALNHHGNISFLKLKCRVIGLLYTSPSASFGIFSHSYLMIFSRTSIDEELLRNSLNTEAALYELLYIPRKGYEMNLFLNTSTFYDHVHGHNKIKTEIDIRNYWFFFTISFLPLYIISSTIIAIVTFNERKILANEYLIFNSLGIGRRSLIVSLAIEWLLSLFLALLISFIIMFPIYLMIYNNYIHKGIGYIISYFARLFTYLSLPILISIAIQLFSIIRKS